LIFEQLWPCAAQVGIGRAGGRKSGRRTGGEGKKKKLSEKPGYGGGLSQRANGLKGAPKLWEVEYESSERR